VGTSVLPANTKLIFLVGAPRSGTTWLQLLLSASPAIATAQETHLFNVYLRSLFVCWKSHRDGQAPIGLPHVFGETEYLALIRELAAKVMMHILAAKPGATIVLEKTPGHALCWRDILAVFPDACFIHIIRDPRSVVASMRAASRGWGSDWAPRRLPDACAQWDAHVRAGREIGHATKNYLELYYRDLRNDAVSTLRSVFAWCGVDASETETDAILKEHEIDRLRSGKELPIGPAPAAGFFRRGETEGWRKDLSAREIWLVEQLTGKLMAELGYDPDQRVSRTWRFASILPALAADWFRDGMAWRLQKYGNVLKCGF